MIPTMILVGAAVGLLRGRWWWRVGVVVSALLWPALLVVTGDIRPTNGESLIGAFVVAAAIATVGAVAAQAVVRVVRSAHA